jgi:hypothetical protein
MGDQPRERRFEPDEPDYPPDYPPEPGRYRPRSGAVTAVAIINFILAGLTVLGALLVVVLGGWFVAIFTGAANEAAKQGGDPDAAKVAGQAGGVAAAIIGVFVVCFLIVAVLYLLAGIGVLNRRQYGRVITLILGALAGLSALWALVGIGRNPGGSLISIVLNGGYCVFTYVVLLNSQNAREFVSPR